MASRSISGGKDARDPMLLFADEVFSSIMHGLGAQEGLFRLARLRELTEAVYNEVAAVSRGGSDVKRLLSVR